MDELTGRPRARLRVAAEQDSGELVAALGGELDLAGAEDVSGPLQELLDRPPQPLQLDLTDVDFLDSSGVALLLRLANHFAPVRTRAAAEPVRRVIEVLGLADRLGLDGT